MTLLLPGTVIIRDTPEDLFDALGHSFMGAARRAVADRGVFHVALSGGSTPEPFYRLLVIDPRFRGIPWEATHVWVVDERCVPPDDPRHNYSMIRESLLEHVPILPGSCHPMPVLEGGGDERYEQELRSRVECGGDGLPRLDFVLLGMGDDAHTASLFPRSDANRVVDRFITFNRGPHVTPPDRMTMTFPLLNAARAVGVLAVGAKKRATLGRVSEHLSEHPPDPVTLPITGVQPRLGELAWWLDTASAGVE